MTERDVVELVRRQSAQKVLDVFAKMTEAERRACAGPVGALFKDWYSTAFSFRQDKVPSVVRFPDALRIAMLATATPSELKRYSFHVIPQEFPLAAAIRALGPTWLDRWVSDLVEDSPHFVFRLAPLWQQGLCRRPESDAFILSYYAHHFSGPALDSDPDFLNHDVWRFFEVEGGGEFSLASHDKYSAPPSQWQTVLLRLCNEGKLDRQRLLDAALDALERDFGQFRAGWYSRFFNALDPTLDELAERAGRFYGLLSSTIPPTVSFALKALARLDKADRMVPEDLLASLGPALQARQKSTVTGALRLLASAAKKDPSCAQEAARLAATALISEAAEVQTRTLNLVEKLGGTSRHVGGLS